MKVEEIKYELKPLQVWNPLLLHSPCSPVGAAHGADVSWDDNNLNNIDHVKHHHLQAGRSAYASWKYP